MFACQPLFQFIQSNLETTFRAKVQPAFLCGVAQFGNILQHPFPFFLCALCETTHIGFLQKVGFRLLGKVGTDILYIPVYIGIDGC